jgi:uncharacterized phiE125 gp8 family phage protein
MSGFGCAEIVLPYPPLVSITSFAYTDSAGAAQTLAADTGYRIVNAGALARAVLAPPYGGSWPSARSDYGAVRITFTAGYAITDGVDTLPEAIKAWALLQVGGLYERRESIAAGDATALPASFIDSLIWPFRVF